MWILRRDNLRSTPARQAASGNSYGRINLNVKFSTVTSLSSKVVTSEYYRDNNHFSNSKRLKYSNILNNNYN